MVGWLGACQAQDYAAAKWGLGLRMRRASDEDVDRAFDDGAILRTHVMRPTWHFVLPQDIRWMLALTAPRVKAILAHYDRQLDVNETLLFRSYRVFTRALAGGTYLTRAGLAERLAQHAIDARGPRLGRIVMHAELDGILCSGPRSGKHFTYALLEERVPPARPMSREEALAKLASKYFASHGPAQLRDFSWWSGLSMSAAREGVALVRPALVDETVEGKTYWRSRDSRTPRSQDPAAHLLPIYDEYTVAYADRSALISERGVRNLAAVGNALVAVIIFHGILAGTWKRAVSPDGVEIRVRTFRPLGTRGRRGVRDAAERYARFLTLPARVTVEGGDR